MKHDEIDRTLAGLGISNVKFTFDAGEADDLIDLPGSTVNLAEALRSAVEAFLHDQKGTGGGDSPAGLIKDTPEFHGLPKTAPAAEIAARLREYLTTDQDSEIVLLTESVIGQDRYRFTPEMGESIRDSMFGYPRFFAFDFFVGIFFLCFVPAGIFRLLVNFAKSFSSSPDNTRIQTNKSKVKEKSKKINRHLAV
jgi:hypothetical protein